MNDDKPDWPSIAEANPPPPEWYEGDEERLWESERHNYWLGLLAWSVPVVLAVALLEAIVQWVTR